MNKPQGYDESQAFTGEFETLESGGYICVIKQAKIDFTDDKREILVLLFDISEGDHKGFYQRLFDSAKQANPDAKWRGVYRQLTSGKSTPFFKGLITSIEASNKGYKWDWNEASLKDKLFGAIFGREQYESSGDLKWSTKCQGIRSVEAVRKGIDPPADKYLKAGYAPAGLSASDDDGDIPF